MLFRSNGRALLAVDMFSIGLSLLRVDEEPPDPGVALPHTQEGDECSTMFVSETQHFSQVTGNNYKVLKNHILAESKRSRLDEVSSANNLHMSGPHGEARHEQ